MGFDDEFAGISDGAVFVGICVARKLLSWGKGHDVANRVLREGSQGVHLVAQTFALTASNLQI